MIIKLKEKFTFLLSKTHDQDKINRLNDRLSKINNLLQNIDDALSTDLNGAIEQLKKIFYDAENLAALTDGRGIEDQGM